MLAYKFAACEVCIIWRKAYRSIKNPSPIAESRTGKPAMFTSTVPLSMTRPCGWTYLCAAILGCGTGPRFTNGFSIPIKIRWKFHFTLISILIPWSLQNFVHGTTAVLSWHVQKFVAIWWPATEYGPVTMISSGFWQPGWLHTLGADGHI